MKKRFIVYGALYITLGMLFLTRAFSGLTGFVIFEGNTTYDSVVGLVFVVGGIALALYSKKD